LLLAGAPHQSIRRRARWRAIAHPAITPHINVLTPNATLHTPSGGRHNPTEQGRGPDPTVNHNISAVIPHSNTAASKSFQRVKPSPWRVIIKAAVNRTAAMRYAMPAGT